VHGFAKDQSPVNAAQMLEDLGRDRFHISMRSRLRFDAFCCAENEEGRAKLFRNSHREDLPYVSNPQAWIDLVNVFGDDVHPHYCSGTLSTDRFLLNGRRHTSLERVFISMVVMALN
jgi:hypothetical protein